MTKISEKWRDFRFGCTYLLRCMVLISVRLEKLLGVQTALNNTFTLNHFLEKDTPKTMSVRHAFHAFHVYSACGGACISNYNHRNPWYVITHPFPNFYDGLTNPLLKLGHRKAQAHRKLWISLLIHVLISGALDKIRQWPHPAHQFCYFHKIYSQNTLIESVLIMFILISKCNECLPIYKILIDNEIHKMRYLCHMFCGY